ncbi:3-oxoadipate enol-lactonase [Mesorhizobium sp. SB112]|uniref:3-oxoadipate enol-lactonase n=1 Tax=Mesorhizobium sp. SB112 TaxID=3151853 RepID=UPI003265B171
MAFANCNGVVLHYRVSGPADGLPLVLSNSLGTDHRIWDDVVAILSNRYKILAYDKRGHGLSDAPEGPYSVADHAADLLALTKIVGFDRFALCGVSVGGMIAQYVAANQPGKVAALILCDTAVKIGNAETWNARIEAVRRDGIASISEAILERWLSPSFRTERKDDYSGWRNLLERTSPVGYAATCETVRDADLTDDAARIEAPTLVICGENDLSTPPALVSETAKLIRSASFKTIAGAGHIPSIEQAEILAGLMRSHFEEANYV